jgi:hypothetical protein
VQRSGSPTVAFDADGLRTGGARALPKLAEKIPSDVFADQATGVIDKGAGFATSHGFEPDSDNATNDPNDVLDRDIASYADRRSYLILKAESQAKALPESAQSLLDPNGELRRFESIRDTDEGFASMSDAPPPIEQAGKDWGTTLNGFDATYQSYSPDGYHGRDSSQPLDSDTARSARYGDE